MKVMVVMGTRPEVIKLAPVVDALKTAAILTVVCASGQHREMLAQALQVFSIEPDVMFDAMRPGQTLNALAARLLADMDIVLEKERPDWVVVQGDTTTAFCSGFAAFQRDIRVAHVEAGLRTGDLASPFPEEANRSLLARVATLHFAPTQAARRALRAEGVADDAIHVTGNTVVDAIEKMRRSLPAPPATQKPFVLVTCHRRENFGPTLENICRALKRLCERHADFDWLFPVHLNPNVREPVQRMLADIPNLHLVEPVDYLASLAAISRAALVLTDSGGIQEEAPSFGVPAVVMREHTERGEGVAAGFATLAGQGQDAIVAAVDDWLAHPEKRAALKNRPNPYGDGQASQRIVARLQGEPAGEFGG